MNGHKILFFGVFALVAAMLFNWIGPKISGSTYAQKLSNPASGNTKLAYAGKTAVTGAALATVLIGAAFLLGLAGERTAGNPAIV